MVIDSQTVHSYATGLSQGSIAIFDTDARALGLLVDHATLLISQKRYDDAEALLVDLCDLAPGTASAPCMLGDLRMKRGDPQGAARAYSDSIDRARNAGKKRIEQLALLGRAHARKSYGQVEHAWSDLLAASRGVDAKLAAVARAGMIEGDLQ